MAVIRFLPTSGLLNSFIREVMVSTTPFGENRLKEQGGRKLLYILNTRDKVATVVSFSFTLKKATGK
jgi:hypothetical protein